VRRFFKSRDLRLRKRHGASRRNRLKDRELWKPRTHSAAPLTRLEPPSSSNRQLGWLAAPTIFMVKRNSMVAMKSLPGLAIFDSAIAQRRTATRQAANLENPEHSCRRTIDAKEPRCSVMSNATESLE